MAVISEGSSFRRIQASHRCFRRRDGIGSPARSAPVGYSRPLALERTTRCRCGRAPSLWRPLSFICGL